MAEEENKKKGRLATAVLAGSALAFSSFAFGMPAALAQGEAEQGADTQNVEQGDAETPNAETTDEANTEEVSPQAGTEDEESPEPSGESSATADETESTEPPSVPEDNESPSPSDTLEVPSIDLSVNSVKPGGSITVTGTHFEPGADVDLQLQTSDDKPTEVEIPSERTNSEGELNFTLSIPAEFEPGLYQVYAHDAEHGAHAYHEFSVIEDDDPAEPSIEPVLTIEPQEIAVEDFIGDEQAGVLHTVEGLEEGADIEYAVAAPEGVKDFDGTEIVDENGIASFSIHGFDGTTPETYVGDYTTVVTFEDEDGNTSELSGDFSVVEASGKEPTPDPTPDPVEELQVELAKDELYPGDTLEVAGSGFTSEGTVELSWNPTTETSADADGNITVDLNIPEDTDPGAQELTVTDETSGASTTAEFTVLDPADQEAEPGMTIDPEEIAVDDFMGDPEDGAGVDHAVQGLEPGSEITYVVTGPEGVNDFESRGRVSDDGTADFVIYAPETSTPAVYLGEYTTVVTYENEDGETSELQGNFTVVSGTGGNGAGESGDQADPVVDAGDPVDLNGSDNLAQTGASNTQLGLLAGLLLAVGGALVVYTNRAQLFSRKH